MASQQPSGRLASALIIQARSYINEVTPIMVSDAEFLQWLNDGTMHIVTQSHCLESKEPVTLAIGTMAYALSQPFICIKGVVFKPISGITKGLLRGNLQSIGHGATGDDPTYWVQAEDSVLVYPVPTAVDAIDVYTVTRPVDVASGVAVLVPACYDQALVFYMAAQAWFKDGKFAKAGSFMAACGAEINRYRMDFVTVPKEPVEIVK